MIDTLQTTYPHETTDHVWVPISDLYATEATYVTEGVEYSVVPMTTPVVPRPVMWRAAVVIGGRTTVLVTGMAAGDYAVWGRVTAGDDLPVFFCGVLTLS